jgi:hypothetical protein
MRKENGLQEIMGCRASLRQKKLNPSVHGPAD